MVEQLLPVLILIVITTVFAGGLIYLVSLLGEKPKGSFLKDPIKQMPYECGIAGEESATTKIPIKFYLIAISFILFDIEIIFLYPWTLIFIENIKEIGGFLLLSIGFFIGVLVYGLIYEWKAGGLEWD